MAWALMVLLLLAAALLLFAQALREQRRRALVLGRLQGHGPVREAHQPWAESQLLRLAATGWARRYLGRDGETQLYLNRIGWRRAGQRALFLGCQLASPVLLLALAVLLQTLQSDPLRPLWVLPFLAVGCGLLLPKRLLALAAARRQRQLVEEVSTFLPLLRILFDSGLTVEQSLRVLANEGGALMPALSRELLGLLKRVDSGLELGDELVQLTRLLEVDELSDCLGILEQLIRQGGGAMGSLLALKKLLDDRRLTRLQEYISKLSGKLAVVMMVFLFPALLIVLAGPGLRAIGQALGGNG